MEKVIDWAGSDGIRRKVSAEFDNVTFVSSFQQIVEQYQIHQCLGKKNHSQVVDEFVI